MKDFIIPQKSSIRYRHTVYIYISIIIYIRHIDTVYIHTYIICIYIQIKQQWILNTNSSARIRKGKYGRNTKINRFISVWIFVAGYLVIGQVRTILGYSWKKIKWDLYLSLTMCYVVDTIQVLFAIFIVHVLCFTLDDLQRGRVEKQLTRTSIERKQNIKC